MKNTKLFIGTLLLFGFSCLVACNSELEKPTTENPNVNKQEKVTQVIEDTVKVIPEFWLYGELMPVDYIDDADSSAREFGFNVKRIAGCEVETEMIESLIENNQKMNELMINLCCLGNCTYKFFKFFKRLLLFLLVLK